MTKKFVKILLISIPTLFIVFTAVFWVSLDKPKITYPETLNGRFAILPAYSRGDDECGFYIVNENTIDSPESYACVGYDPVWSPDGERIAFITYGLWFDKVTVMDVTTSVTQSYEIRRENTVGKDKEGNLVSQLAGCRFGTPQWTQDGQSVIAECALNFFFQDDEIDEIREGPTVLDSHHIFTWNPEINQNYEITVSDDLDWWRMSPSSNKNALIVNVERRDPKLETSRQTWLVDITTGDYEVLIDCESLTGNKECFSIFSPQEHYVAVTTDEKLQIFNQQYEEIAAFNFWAGSVVWSPDETQLAFLHNGELTLYQLETQETRVLQHQEKWLSFWWRSYSPDLRKIQWLDSAHLAVLRDAWYYLPRSMEHSQKRTRLQVIRIMDNQIWTLFEVRCGLGCTIQFDWTPIAK